jgi:redox-sensitive bicupin YhaK (pirin superfamily)
MAKFIKLTAAEINWANSTAEAAGGVYFNADHIVYFARDDGDPCTGICLTNDPVPSPEGWTGGFVMETPEQILELIAAQDPRA